MPQVRKKSPKPEAAPNDAPRVFSFCLILAGAGTVTPEIADALYEAGCDDALVGSRSGSLFADFDRGAPSLAEAITTAIRQVESAGVGLTVVRVEPDELVSTAEIAERAGLNRETIRLYTSGRRGPGDFPAPVARLRGRSPLYRWADVAPWLVAHGTGASADDAGETALLVGVLNAALDLRRLAPRAFEHAWLREALGIDLTIADRQGRLLFIEGKHGDPAASARSPKPTRRLQR